ncbi:MAG: hypothetical protein FD145_921 [Candidatus Saganbacteria bacterium]|uniref:SLH domain-containing protein n=1 Tax=Candidatus Saganbacteria bacterium TaxID=2575572 RepID=A0A833NWY7_UNCSA|nr:MAG: hypothetical protein FD145_921 [Candidatus Saganbacteria bacterium]
MSKKLIVVSLLLLIAAAASFAQSAPDPIRIATGARPLGLGKAFVGLADDVSSIYLNPSGLANVDRWQMTSMWGKFLDDYSYFSLTGMYPTNYGNFGLGFVGGSIGGALPTRVKEGSDPADPIYEVDPTTDPMSYYNNVFIVTYADQIKRILEQPVLKNYEKYTSWFSGLKGLNIGANLKFFRSGLSGDHITNGSASGMEVDMGVQGKPLNWLAWGLNLQNALPASWGGKLTYANGWTETYPALLKGGVVLNVLGEEDSLRQIGPHKVNLLWDVDWEVQRSSQIPMLMHLGIEWLPLDLIALRVGIDQEMVGIGRTFNNFAAGVGINYSGFRFDYAYHQFAGAPGVDNHFFSMSYGLFKGKKKEAHKVIVEPDKLITFDATAILRGKVLDFEVATIKINGADIMIQKGNTFEAAAPLKVGKNTFNSISFTKTGATIEVDKSRILRLITYPDVSKTFWGFEQIGYIGTLGIIQGYPDGKFKPDGNITRAELSALLVRTLMGSDKAVPASAKGIFKDVPLTHWASKYINMASSKDIVKGYPDKTFKPAANITRAEGLAMIARFGKVNETIYGNVFSDVNDKHWAAAIIAGAYKEKMLEYFKDKPFEPSKMLTRAEAVEMLFRAKPVNLLILDLKDFNKGY